MKPPSVPAAEVQAALARERRRIGDHLHENLCQNLAVMSIQVELLRRQLQAGKPAEELLETLAQTVQSSIEQAHAIAHELQSPLVAGNELPRRATRARQGRRAAVRVRG